MRIRPASHRDLPAIARLLAAAGLPDGDIGAHVATLLVGEQRREVVAAGALEPLGSAALLRSVVVAPELRGRGRGRRITERLLAFARELGVRDVYLLTTDAADYFATLGFERVARDSAPEPLRRTRQFAGLCPTSAVLMRRGPGAAPARPRAIGRKEAT